MGRLYVARHGQSGHNAEQILQGPRLDGELSDLGRQQAAALAQALRDAPLQAVFTSPLQRARETAEIVVREHPGRLALQVVPELYEVDYGQFIGRRIEDVRDELEQVLDAWRIGFVDHAFPGGESALVAQHRLRPFVERLRAQAREEDVLVVAHGRINRVLLATLTHQGLDHLEDFPQSNAAITELEVVDEVHVVRRNDTSHLDLAGDAFS